ncbi:MAG TPA: hypothetical protein PKV72_03800 [Candidatus Peribacteria bacterium]|nr:hypothetical protein [Candidatus Peribacteria bacterium]
MREAPIHQETTERQVHACVHGDRRPYVALYIGSSDPIGLLNGAVPRGERVTSVTGGCEYPIALLHNEPSSLHLFDVSPIATAAAEVKLRCLRTLDRGDFERTWTPAADTPLSRSAVFDRHVVPHLSPAALAATEVLSDAETMRRIGNDVAKRDRFAVPELPGDGYERLQHIALCTDTRLSCANVLDLPAPIGEPHTLYISNVGIIHDHTRGYAARLAQIGWQRVLFTTSDIAEDHFGSKVYTTSGGRWGKRPDMEYWTTVESFYDCRYRVLGHEDADFPLLVECASAAELRQST